MPVMSDVPAALLNGLQQTWPEFVRAISNAIAAEQAPSAPTHTAQAVELFTAAFVRALHRGHPTEDDLADIRRMAASRARDGASLDEFLAALTAGIEAGLSQLSTLAAAHSEDPLGVMNVVSVRVVRTHSAVQLAVADGFAEGLADPAEGELGRVVTAVDRVLFGSSEDDADESLPFDGGTEHHGWVVLLLAGRGARGVDQLRAASSAMRDAHPDQAFPGPLVARPVPHIPVVARVELGSSPITQLVGLSRIAARSGCLVVPSRPAASLQDLRRRYEPAIRNLGFARLVPARHGCIPPAVLQQCRVRAASPDVERGLLFREALGQLVDDGRVDLLNVLDALVAFGTADAAAEHLGIHPGTIRRHLDAVKRATGLDWQDPWDRFTVGDAVLCRWIAAADPDKYSPGTYGAPPIGDVVDRRD